MKNYFATRKASYYRKMAEANVWDPRWNVVALGNFWICPYCRQIGVENVPQSMDLTGDIVRHLQESCSACDELAGSLASLAEVRRAALGLEVRVGLGKNALWRFRDVRGHWHCPFCREAPRMENQFIVLENPITPRTVEMVESHLLHCVWYAHGEGKLITKSEMRSVIALADREWQFADKVKEKLRKDRNWLRKGDRSKWLCPYCRTAVESIDISTDFLILETAPLRISKHLMHSCDAFRIAGGEYEGGLPAADAVEQAMKENLVAAHDDMARFHASREKLSEARSRQESMAIAPPTIAGYDIGTLYEPGSEVAGDFYCFMDMGGGRIGIAVGDVAGHGLEASSAMEEAMRLLLRCGAGESSPAKALVAMNDTLVKLNRPEVFISVVYAVLDTPGRKLTLARAGHAPPLLCRAHQTPPVVQVDPPGMIMGVSEEGFRESIRESHVSLDRGDILLMTSFGILDCPNLSGERFGASRTAKILKQYHATPAKEMLKKLCETARSYSQGSEIEDDFTAVAIRVL